MDDFGIPFSHAPVHLVAHRQGEEYSTHPRDITVRVLAFDVNHQHWSVIEDVIGSVWLCRTVLRTLYEC